MRLKTLKLQNFRNIEFQELEFEGDTHFFCAPNGQGKTNILEAIGLLSALRSFRTSDGQALLMEKQTESKLKYTVESAGETHEIFLSLHKKGKEVQLDGDPVKRLADYIGIFPTVALAADDIRLVRGQPGIRRRYIDLILSSVDRDYFLALQHYHKALKQRNALLKIRSSSDAELATFEQLMVEDAKTLVEKRAEGTTRIAENLCLAYGDIADSSELPGLLYQPNTENKSAADFATLWEEDRVKDRERQTSRHGPHRDDYELRLLNRSAATYASEGQQRALTLALMLAQVHFLKSYSGKSPIILADDILGQLDPERQKRFWAAIDSDCQIFASGTTLAPDPPGSKWIVWKVEDGKVTRG